MRKRGEKGMKRIIYVQNAVISLLAVTAVRTWFHELGGVKLLVVSVIGFFVLYYAILQVERWWLRHEKKRKGKSAGNTVHAIPWYKMRYPVSGETDRDTRGNSTAVQKRTGYNPLLQTGRYR
jgi:hypothetical protein